MPGTQHLLTGAGYVTPGCSMAFGAIGGPLISQQENFASCLLRTLDLKLRRPRSFED